MALHYPDRVSDFLVYASLIAKAAYDYKGTPWLSYDTHFRTLAASLRLQTWCMTDQSLWSQHFNRAVLRASNDGALAIGPYNQESDHKSGNVKLVGGLKYKENPYPLSPICLKWNKEGCRRATCTYRLDCHGPHKEADYTAAKIALSRPSEVTFPTITHPTGKTHTM